MIIAIISDSHDNLPNIEKFLAWAKANNVALIIHCGDLAAPSIIKNELGPKFSGPIHFVHGNVADRELNEKVSREFANVTCHGDLGELEIEGRKIAFCHFPQQAKDLAQTGKYQLVFYGHTHQPWMETLPNNVQLVNPGTLAGMFNKATFAVYDTATNKLELKILELL